jgi:hypothetical protein
LSFPSALIQYVLYWLYVLHALYIPCTYAYL